MTRRTAIASSRPATNPDGSLLMLVIAGLYVLFTLLPNSTTRMVTWPWVALWQALLMLPVLWLLWQAWHKPFSRFRLGNGFDWIAGFTLIGLLISTTFADFPQSARWYSWAAIGGLAALYGLMGWLNPQRIGFLLKAQATLALVFIVVSLSLWGANTYLPELARLSTLSALGVDQGFNLGLPNLRNGFPLGHQNYVAGYLVLVLPLFFGLAIHDKTRHRWVWVGGIVLGLVTLYTTSSRGGILAIAALLVPAIIGLLLSDRVPRRIVIASILLGVGLLGVLILSNPRLQVILTALRTGTTASSQFAYRLITNTVGWRMGLERPWAGLGPGSVPILYQRYRPDWGGREAELHHQLHSTPAQLWAELGVWGVLLPLLAAVLLGIALWRRRQDSLPLPPSLVGCLVSSVWAYGVFSLTDYQLDVIAIGGMLIVYLAALLYHLRSPEALEPPTDLPNSRRRWLVGAGLGSVLAVGLWLLPFHRAWMASSYGFLELQRGNFSGFVDQLQRSQRIAPWESYYPFQLGWNIGNLLYEVEDLDNADQVRADAIAGFRQGNEDSPYQEFGHSNLGWLVAPQDPAAAIAAFSQSAQLIPAKMGVFFGLGYSLLLNNQPELAVEAMAIELVRHPLTITSPVWGLEPFTIIYPAVLSRTEAILTDLIDANRDFELTALAHQIRGTLRWWTNDLDGAIEDWQEYGTGTSRAVLTAAQGDMPNLDILPELPGKYALQAWYEPGDRIPLLTKAWVGFPETGPALGNAVPTNYLETIAATMEASDSFDQWLKQNAPQISFGNARLGFGVFMRHDDGPTPSDFYVRVENVALLKFFSDLVPSPTFMPVLDRELESYRERLLRQMEQE